LLEIENGRAFVIDNLKAFYSFGKIEIENPKFRKILGIEIN
jgi:hypothetical protein